MCFDRTGGELLFNLLTDRFECRATVVTTNLALAKSVTVFAGDEKLTAALLDDWPITPPYSQKKAKAIACASGALAMSRRDPVEPVVVPFHVAF